MASRTDQLQSHQFLMRRVVAALAMREPDPTYSPLRRTGGGLVAGVLLTLLAVSAVGVYGLLRPGGDLSWREGGSVIVERETGSRFVYRDGVLHPVVNYTSALLILGASQPSTILVARGSLSGVPRGVPLGIPGAPDALPTAAELMRGEWTVCSRPGLADPTSVESVLQLAAAGRVLAGTAEPLGERAVLASDPAGGLHLIWRARRFPIRDADIVLAAFAWSRQSAREVAPALLNAVPVGAQLGRLPIPNQGERSSVAGLPVGQVFVVENQSGGRQFGVVLQQGLADITQVQAGLLLADRANGLSAQALPLSQARYAAAPRAASLVPDGPGVPPESVPQLVTSSAWPALCASFAGSDPAPRLTLASIGPRSSGEVRAPQLTGAALDWIVVPPGRGALVRAQVTPGQPAGSLALVSDLGLRFPIPSAEVLRVLGFPPEQVPVQALPAALVAALPAGPALDPAAAARPAATGRTAA